MTDKNCTWESFKVEGAAVVDKIRAILREGNVRRVIVEHKGRTVAEFPLTVGVVGAVLAPLAAAIAAVVALFKECTIHVERASPDNTPPRDRTSPSSAGVAVLILAASLVAGIPVAASPADQHDHAAATATKREAGSATAPDTMAMQHGMMADRKAADARLQALVETMNGSKGDAKVDAMSAVIAELLAERTAMRAHMEQCPMMMKPPTP